MWYFAAGDAGFYFQEQLARLSWLPVVWHPEQGFGASSLSRLWFEYSYQLFAKVLSTAGLSWWSIDKLLWLSALVLGIYCSFMLARYVLGNTRAAILASIIYSSNTYVLLLFGGGQIGVTLAYCLSPIVLLKFIETIDNREQITNNKEQRTNSREQIVSGLLLALLIAFDLRFAYLVLIAVALYQVIKIKDQGLKINDKKILNTLYLILNTYLVPIIVAVLLHAFWILPTLLASGGLSELGEQFTNPGMLKFLSVADFSHALSFLHPNWPENLFGKVYFLQPEFLVLPILAFASLVINDQRLKIKDKNTSIIHHSSLIYFFGLLALAGAFLAKGVQEPFGGIFQWMFTHIPGFVMFRDPTKFYLFIALGYSILIPFVIEKIAHELSIKYQVLGIRYKNILNTKYLILNTLFVLFWVFTLRPVFLGTMAGNFRPPSIVPEYVRLKDELVKDSEQSRVLWIPEGDTFTYRSEVHPLLTSNELYDHASVSAMIELVKQPEFLDRLQEWGVKYVIVPQDLERRMFLSDYTFNPDQRDALVDALKQTTLLHNPDYVDLAVFRNQEFTFSANTPEAVYRQRQWSTIGLYISAASVLIALGILTVKKRI